MAIHFILDHAIHAGDADAVPIAGFAPVKGDRHGAVAAVMGNAEPGIWNSLGGATGHGKGIAMTGIPGTIAEIANLDFVPFIRIGAAGFGEGAVGDDDAGISAGARAAIGAGSFR